MVAATATRRGGEKTRWRNNASATRTRLDRHARPRPRLRLRRRRRPPAKKRLLKVWPLGGTGASAQLVVGGGEGVHLLIETVLLVARCCVGRDLVDVCRRVIREVTTRLLATQGFFACLSDEAIVEKASQAARGRGAARCDTNGLWLRASVGRDRAFTLA